MSKLPNIKKMRREDLADAPAWIDRLIQPLNQFMELIYSSLNRNLTFADNMQAQIKELPFTTTADYVGSSFFKPLNFSKDLTVKYTGLLLLQIIEDVGGGMHIPIKTAPYIDWLDLGNGTVRIYFISGLKDSTSYTLRLLAF